MSFWTLSDKMRIYFVKFLFYYFKIFGIATLSYKTSHKNTTINRLYFEPSKSDFLYNGILVIVTIVLKYFTVKFFYEYDVTQKAPKFDRLFYRFLDGLNVTQVIFTSVIYCIRQQEIVVLANKIVRIGEFLIKNRNSCTRNITVKVFVINTLIWLIIMTTAAMAFEIRYFPYFVGRYFTNLIITALVIQYVSILKILEEFYKIINANLSNLTNKRAFAATINNTQEKMETILSLSQVYTQLNEVSLELSKFYSQPMMLYILNTFSDLMCTSYGFVKPIIFGTVCSSFIILVHAFFVGMMDFILLIFLTKATSAIITEVRIQYKI